MGVAGGSSGRARANTTQYVLRVLPGGDREVSGWFGRARHVSVELHTSNESVALTSSTGGLRSAPQVHSRSAVLAHASLASCALIGLEREHLFYVAPGARRARGGEAAGAAAEESEVEDSSAAGEGQLRSEHVWSVQRPSVLCASERRGLFSHPTGVVDERAALNLLVAVRTRPSQLARRMVETFTNF